VFGQVRPGIDQPGQLRGHVGPVCATSVQPNLLLGWKYLIFLVL
jgi:hypothetical protein